VELVEQFLGILDKQTKLVDELASMKSGGNTLVSKNIIKSDNSTFDSDSSQPSKLNSKERARTAEASSIFISKFFSEEKKHRKDTAEKTSISKLVKPTLQTKSKSLTGISDKKGGGGLMEALMGMLGLGSLSKLIKPGALIKSLFKKGLATISSKLKGVISSIWGGTKNLTSKMITSLKDVTSKALDGVKGVFGSIKDKALGMFEKVGTKISGLWGTITNSSAYKTFSGLIDDAASAISKVFQGVKNKVGTFIESGSKLVSKYTPEPIKAGAAKAGSALKTAGKATSSWLGRASGFIKSTAGEAAGGAVKYGKAAGGAVKGFSKGAVDSAKGLVASTFQSAIKKSGGMIGMMGKLTAKSARGVAKVPIIGPAIEAAFTAYDIAEMKKKGLSDSELQQLAGKRVISGVTGMIGMASGSLLAGALGSIVPGAGTALGVILGGMAGDVAGRFLGGLVTDYIIPKKYTKTIGAFVTGTPPPRDEMQDFIIKNGKVHKFSSKDDVMGMKTGGAIDDFLKGGSGNNQTMQKIVQANNISNQYLRAIAHNTAMMVNKLSNNSSGGRPIIVSSPQSKPAPTKQMVTIPNNRSGYSDSAYAL